MDRPANFLPYDDYPGPEAHVGARWENLPVTFEGVNIEGRLVRKGTAAHRLFLIFQLVASAVVLSLCATMSIMFAVENGQPSEHRVLIAMTVISAIALGGAVVFSENAWVRGASVAALCATGVLGAIANYTLLEPPADLASSPPDAIRWLVLGPPAVIGPALAYGASLVYRASKGSTDRAHSTVPEVAPTQ